MQSRKDKIEMTNSTNNKYIRIFRYSEKSDLICCHFIISEPKDDKPKIRDVDVEYIYALRNNYIVWRFYFYNF